MSVLIRGMDMPKSCKTCDLLQDYDGDMYCPLKSYLNFGDIENVPDYVMDGCPLVEVKTPHGRLIDESSIKYDSEAVRCMDDGHIWHELCVCKDVIEDLPTVLGPEE